MRYDEPRLETERLVLRPFAAGDLDALAAIDADPEVPRHLFREPASRARSRARLAAHIAHWAEHGFGLWAVAPKASGALIGDCGLRWLSRLEDVELHYVFARHAWGLGYATEAAAAALEHGFGTVGLERVVAFARADNAASVRVMRKLGMSFERSDNDRGADMVFYALSADAFREGRLGRR